MLGYCRSFICHARTPTIFNLEFRNDLSLVVFIRLYTTSLSRYITKHNINHHLYANDTNVYISLSPLDIHLCQL